MKKLAMLLAVCMLCTGAAVYAEDAESTQTEAPEMEVIEIDREVWRGEVTAVDADSITLKIIEYNPENPRLPEPENGMTELPEGGLTEEVPDEAMPAGEAEDETIAMSGESAAEAAEEDSEIAEDAEDAVESLPEGEDGTPVEVVSIAIGEETLCYTSEPAETVEAKIEKDNAEVPEEDMAEAPVEHYVFEEAALEDVLVGNILTVEVVDGTAAIVVIESEAVIPAETDM